MAYGKWIDVGVLIDIGGQLYIVPQDSQGGKLILEEYDPSVGASSEKSKFFEVNTVRITNRKPSDGQEVVGRLSLNLSDDSVTELTE